MASNDMKELLEKLQEVKKQILDFDEDDWEPAKKGRAIFYLSQASPQKLTALTGLPDNILKASLEEEIRDGKILVGQNTFTRGMDGLTVNVVDMKRVVDELGEELKMVRNELKRAREDRLQGSFVGGGHLKVY